MAVLIPYCPQQGNYCKSWSLSNSQTTECTRRLQQSFLPAVHLKEQDYFLNSVLEFSNQAAKTKLHTLEVMCIDLVPANWPQAPCRDSLVAKQCFRATAPCWVLLKANISSNNTFLCCWGRNQGTQQTPSCYPDLCVYYNTVHQPGIRTDKYTFSVKKRLKRSTHSSWMMKYSLRVSNVSINWRIFGWLTLKQTEKTDLRLQGLIRRQLLCVFFFKQKQNRQFTAFLLIKKTVQGVFEFK